MKLRWMLAASVAALLALAVGTAFAQDHHDHHWDKDHPAFDDHEHEAVRGWWAGHRDHPVIGFRAGDRLPPDWEGRLRVGFVLDTGWRHRLHPLPHDLYVLLPPPPPHFTYYVVGGHVVLVDGRDWHVADIINIEL